MRYNLIIFIVIAYFVMGLIQLVAMAQGFTHGLGLPPIIGYALAFFLTWIPLIGVAFGVYGAHAAWGWWWLWAVLFFFWPTALHVVGAIIARGPDAASYARSRLSRSN